MKNLNESELKKNKIFFIENMLKNWGFWLCKDLNNGLGYPSKCITESMRCSSSSLSNNIPVNLEAEEIHKIYFKLKKECPKWAEVLNKHYTRELDQTAKDIAAKIKIAERTYFYYLNMARRYVEKELKQIDY